jgi:hypothetical protein
VGEILRGDGRERYDYFLKNGFPKYKGTGYFYERYRPGTGTVLVGLFIVFGGVAHYGALFLTYKRHKEFVERYIKHARKMAWGDSSGIAGIPGSNGSANGATGFESATQPEDDGNAQAWNRKARRQQEKESKKAGKNPKAARAAREKGISTPVEAELTSGPVGAKKRVHAQNGKVLIVDSVGNVFVEEQTEEGDTIELLLDVSLVYTLSRSYANIPSDWRHPATIHPRHCCLPATTFGVPQVDWQTYQPRTSQGRGVCRG